MIDPNEVLAGLVRAGFRQVGTSSKVSRYERGGETVYLKIKGTEHPLVVHGKHGSKLPILLAIPGVTRNKPSSAPYHNSNMRAFDERKNTGQRRTRYGFDFGFRDVAALADFLSAI